MFHGSSIRRGGTPTFRRPRDPRIFSLTITQEPGDKDDLLVKLVKCFSRRTSDTSIPSEGPVPQFGFWCQFGKRAADEKNRDDLPTPDHTESARRT